MVWRNKLSRFSVDVPNQTVSKCWSAVQQSEAHMRKIILFMHMSLDGMVAGPKGSLAWANMREDAISAFMIPDMLKTTDALLLGRNLYDGFMQYWPMVAKDPKSPPDMASFAQWMDAAPKYVVSKKARTLTWQNAKSIAAPDDAALRTAMQKLKRTKGGDIVIFGGARLSQALTRLNLIDEYRLKLETAAVGAGGVPLFKNLPATQQLKLIFSKAFDSGVMCLYYVPAGKR
jgi:dihydrofolate reductase